MNLAPAVALPWQSCPDDPILSSLSYSLVTLLTMPLVVTVLAVILLFSCICVASGLPIGRTLMQVEVPFTFLTLPLVAGSVAMAWIMNLSLCGAQKYGLLAWAAFGLPFTYFSFGFRTLNYLGLGLGAGVSCAAALINLGEQFSSIFTLASGGMLPLVCGLFGAWLMRSAMPHSVKQRTMNNAPALSVSVEVEFKQEDLYLELLNPTQPLGTTGSFTANSKQTVQNSDGVDKEVIVVGSQRTAVMSNGQTVSELLYTESPRIIVWKQVSSNLAGLYMAGGGEGDEPGVRIQLRDLGQKTRVTIEYFYVELLGPSNLFKKPTLQLSASDLAALMTTQMKSRGYRVNSDAAKGSNSEQKAVKSNTTADDAEAAAIKAKGIAAVAPAPGTAGLKSMV